MGPALQKRQQCRKNNSMPCAALWISEGTKYMDMGALQMRAMPVFNFYIHHGKLYPKMMQPMYAHSTQLHKMWSNCIKCDQVPSTSLPGDSRPVIAHHCPAAAPAVPLCTSIPIISVAVRISNCAASQTATLVATAPHPWFPQCCPRLKVRISTPTD